MSRAHRVPGRQTKTRAKTAERSLITKIENLSTQFDKALGPEYTADVAIISEFISIADLFVVLIEGLREEKRSLQAQRTYLSTTVGRLLREVQELKEQQAQPVDAS